jgi:hypothetical protein
MRIPGENGHVAGCSGYWRAPFRPSQPTGPVEGDVEGDVEGPSDDLPRKLEQVTGQSLTKLSAVLKVPLDASNGTLTRNQVTAALGAVNAQLRADEQRLRAKVQGDVLERLLRLMAEEKKRLRASGVEGQAEGIRLKDLRPAADESKD